MDAIDKESVFVFPATPAQKRFWLLDQLIPGGNPALNMPITLRWHGPLQPPILQQALNELVARHEVLRTTFAPDRKQLQQLISPTLVLDLSIVESNGSIPCNGNLSSKGLTQNDACQPFDLSAGPLLRARLIRVSPNEHLLLLTVHHTVSDGWSNRVIVRDLCASYTALSQGKTTLLPQLPFQFADYADWQITRLAHNDFADQQAYWHEKLAGNFPALDLSVRREQPRGPTVAGETRSRRIPPDLVAAAKTLGVAEGASPFMIHFAVFQALLYRYTGEADFLITSPGANRERVEFESLVGPFANPLLLRADLRGDPTFRELLGRVRTVTLQAFSNQDIPFESLLDEFQAGRLQVNFNYEVRWELPTDLPDAVTIELLPAISTGTVYELSATVLEEPDCLRFEIEYKPSLFDADTVERLLENYETLLQNVIADPAKPLSSLPEFKTGQPPSRPSSLSTREFTSANVPVQPYLGLQLQLIAIWEDVLGVGGIGIRDDFFALGGNSLLAMRMLQRAEATCGKFILPASLFRHPTIEHLAGEMAREVIDESPTLLHVHDAGTRTPFFYLHGDLFGGGFYSLKLSRALGPDQPFYVLPPQDIRLLPAAPTIEEMAAAHLSALRAVRPKGPYVIGGFCIGGVVAYEVAQQLRASGESVEMLLMIDSALEEYGLRVLRWFAETIGWLVRWDDNAKVRRFGRWAHWRGRLIRWFGLNVKDQMQVVWRRISDRFVRASDALRSRSTGGTGSSAIVKNQNDPDRQEPDVPSAFLWAATGYRPQSYSGAVALLLSDDVMRGRRNIAGEWRRLAPKIEVQSLIGSHLECITAHADTLVQTIESCLQRTAVSARPSDPGSASAI